MTIRRIRNHWCVDIRYEKQRYRRQCPINSRQAAQKYEKTLWGKLICGEPLDPPPPEAPTPIFRSFAAHWFETFVRTNNKHSEQRTKESTLRCHLLPWFGHLRIDSIGPQQFEEYKAAKLREDYSPKSINNQLAILRKALQTAVDWELLDHLPRFRWLHTQPVERDFLSLAESRALLDAPGQEPMWHAMILVALRTGMRLGELCGLRWVDVDLEQSIATVRQSIVRGIASSPKTHRERIVPISASVRHALLSLPAFHELVFCRDDGSPLSHHMSERALHRACRRAGLRKIGWHTLRHTCASQLAMLRGTLLEAQRLLGHTTIQMTERYTHVAPRVLHEAVATLDAAHADVEVDGARTLIAPPGLGVGLAAREPVGSALKSLDRERGDNAKPVIRNARERRGLPGSGWAPYGTAWAPDGHRTLPDGRA